MLVSEALVADIKEDEKKGGAGGGMPGGAVWAACTKPIRLDSLALLHCHSERSEESALAVDSESTFTKGVPVPTAVPFVFGKFAGSYR
jgi:hypothetical protein